MEEIIRNGKETLIYSIAKPGDVEEVAQFAEEHFFNSSPILELASFDDPSDKAGQFAWKQGRLQKCFAHPTSIIVREKSSNNIIAFSAMMLEERGRVNNSPYSIKDDRFPGWMNRAIAVELGRGVDLYERYGTDRILHVMFGAVRQDYRGERVLLSDSYCALRDKIIEDHRIGVMKAHAYSRFAPTGKGMDTISTLDLNTFQLPDGDGTKPLAGIDFGVHRIVRLVAQPTRLIQLISADEDRKSQIISKL